MAIMTNLSAEALYHTLQSFLRADLHALYRYPAPSASSPTQDGERWLLVVSSFHYLHDIRVFLRSDSADFPPIAVATPPLLKRYCHTDPIFADQLRQGTTIGTPLSSELIRPASAELNYAYCAHLWLQISPLLTVDSAELYTPYQKLCYLLSLPPHTPLLDLLATLQAQLPKMQLPTATSPALSQSLPTLQAIYNDLDSALLVIDDRGEIAGKPKGDLRRFRCFRLLAGLRLFALRLFDRPRSVSESEPKKAGQQRAGRKTSQCVCHHSAPKMTCDMKRVT